MIPAAMDYDLPLVAEWLDIQLFESVEQAQELAAKWLWANNNDRGLIQRLVACRQGD